MVKKLTTAEFIKRAKSIHGNRYDYSQVKYVNRRTNVTIICRVSEHGPFQQFPYSHTGGNGCSRCSGKAKKTKEMFIIEAKKKHKDIYNYIEVEYVNDSTNVIIKCSEHGKFEETPKRHLMGDGCKTCAFILKASEVHGDKYDYSEVEYVNDITNVIIKCSEHGKFEETPKRHLRGDGCKTCAFILKAIKVHRGKYDYSKVEYVNNSTNVIIICPDHGEFPQVPYSHLNRHGCRDCGIIKCTDCRSHDSNKFIEEAKKKHGDKYDYSKVKYINSHKHVIIKCPDHGPFPQTPAHHLSGKGCRTCGFKRGADKNRKLLAQFIEEAKKVHGDKYCYDKVVYKDIKTKIEIICQTHGPFPQPPLAHLHGHGCPNCGSERGGELISKTHEDFIRDAKIKHGDRYDYRETEYIRSHIPIAIICTEHGRFPQTPTRHLLGQGCPRCSGSIGEKFIDGYLKELGFPDKSQKKFKECFDKKELPFDNAILNTDNLDILIEYDGEPHFMPIEFFGGESKYKIQKKHDIIKNKFCLENNKILLRIAYTDIDFAKTLIDIAIQRSKENKPCIIFSNPLLYKKTYIRFE
jgi:hypothetical protein